MTIACPNCRSKKIVKDGTRYNKYSLVQKYLCTYCDYRFVSTNKRITKYSELIKKLALDLWDRGLTLRAIASHINKFYHVKISNVTVMRWVESR